jgi:hypothetical protein
MHLWFICVWPIILAWSNCTLNNTWLDYLLNHDFAFAFQLFYLCFCYLFLFNVLVWIKHPTAFVCTIFAKIDLTTSLFLYELCACSKCCYCSGLLLLQTKQTARSSGAFERSRRNLCHPPVGIPDLLSARKNECLHGLTWEASKIQDWLNGSEDKYDCCSGCCWKGFWSSGNHESTESWTYHEGSLRY